MAVVDGVTLVADVSIKVLQDGDTYSALLEIVQRLHGRCPFRVSSLQNRFNQLNPLLFTSGDVCGSLRCSGVTACLRDPSAAPYPHAVRCLVAEGAEGERTVWPHCFPPLAAEELHVEEAGQYLSCCASNQSNGPFSVAVRSSLCFQSR